MIYKMPTYSLQVLDTIVYLILTSLDFPLLFSQATNNPNDPNDPNDPSKSIDTRVDIDQELACEHYMYIAMHGGKWGDPDSVMKGARSGTRTGPRKRGRGKTTGDATEAATGDADGGGVDNDRFAADHEEHVVPPAVALVAYEMKAVLGYSAAFASSGHLWNKANEATKQELLGMIAQAGVATPMPRSRTSSEEQEKEKDSGAQENVPGEETPMLRPEATVESAEGEVYTPLGYQYAQQLQQFEQRAVQWWLSAAEHHGDKEAGMDSLFFVGHKCNEMHQYEDACHHYTKALQASLASAASASLSKAYGTLGWHLLLQKSCRVETMQHIALLVGGDEQASYATTASLVFRQAAKHEQIAGMKAVWQVLNVVANGVAWVW